MKKDEGLPAVDNPMPTLASLRGIRLLRQRSAERHKMGYGAKMPPLAVDQVPAVAEAERLLSDLLSPAKPAAIGRMIEALIWHYPHQPRPDHALESIAADWVRDLGHLPADIIDAACTAWRRSTNQFAPTPGHLLEVASPIMAQREFWHRLAGQELAPFASAGSLSPGGVAADAGAFPPEGDLSKRRRGA